MVAQLTFSGSFDADITTLNPQIAICDITSGPDNNCGGAGGTSAVIVFTMTSTPAITVDLTTSQYQVNWDTRGADFDAGHTYRVHITAGVSGARRELGLLATLPFGQYDSPRLNVRARNTTHLQLSLLRFRRRCTDFFWSVR